MMRHAWVHRKGIVMLVGVLSPSVASSSWLTPSELDRSPEWKYTHPELGQGLPTDKRATVVAAFGSAAQWCGATKRVSCRSHYR